MKCYGIIGYPLSHSFSKKYFTEKFQQQQIEDCRYECYPIPFIDELPSLISNNSCLLGLNVTIPYKQSVIAYLDDIGNIPAGMNACNCIKITGGKLAGYNTDITGFERSILPLLKHQHTQALILGDGGAAAAVKFVLQKLNIAYKVVSRRHENGISLAYGDLDEHIIRQNKLIINTTPLGTFPNTDECAGIPYEYLDAGHLLYDLVYNPAKTLFLQKGKQMGAAIKNGYEMLVIQAEESWRIWNDD